MPGGVRLPVYIPVTFSHALIIRQSALCVSNRTAVKIKSYGIADLHIVAIINRP